MNRDLKREREIAIDARGGALRPYKIRQPREPARRSNSVDTTRWLRQAEAEAIEQAEAERLLGPTDYDLLLGDDSWDPPSSV